MAEENKNIVKECKHEWVVMGNNEWLQCNHCGTVSHCTCHVCKDEKTCPWAGEDPFNMDGECLAMK